MPRVGTGLRLCAAYHVVVLGDEWKNATLVVISSCVGAVFAVLSFFLLITSFRQEKRAN
jgi:hypothetical protein